jgi:hypothetical protein
MKAKPNIDAFLDGGAAGERPAKVEPKPRERVAEAPAAPPEFRKQVVMQLPIALINDLKQRALDESVSTGKRVTQQQLVEEALKKLLYK